MDYRERPPPAALAGLVKATWALDCGGDAGGWIERSATPDGCIEIVWRLAGRSIWRREQPACFVAGLIDGPATLRLSGDARFTGLRLWPWAWNLVGETRCGDFLNDWIVYDAKDPEQAIAAIEARAGEVSACAEIGAAILASVSVAELIGRSGCSARWMQRWFRSQIGLTPRHYLGLLRFQAALGGIQRDHETLAGHAAALGYADRRTWRAPSGRWRALPRKKRDGRR